MSLMKKTFATITAATIVLSSGYGITHAESVDITKPQFQNLNTKNISQGATFDPLEGILAIDDVDGDITSKITINGDYSTTVPGKYELTYTVTDLAGNTETKTRILNVIAVKPTINKNSIMKHTQGADFNPRADLSAFDVLGNDLTNKVVVSGTYNVDFPGVYELTYTVTDQWGSTYAIKRTLTVVATTPTLNAFSKSIERTSNYDPLAGVTAYDFKGNDISGRVTVTGDYNASVPGSYSLTFSITDDYGSTTVAVRNLTVR